MAACYPEVMTRQHKDLVVLSAGARFRDGAVNL